jgi:hypothetical protein
MMEESKVSRLGISGNLLLAVLLSVHAVHGDPPGAGARAMPLSNE